MRRPTEQLLRVYIISKTFLYIKRLLCVLIKKFGTPAHHESNKNAVCRFSTPLPEKSELKIRHHSSVLFYPQNRLYPTIISAAAVITRKKVVGNIKAQVIPKPTQNSIRPHNRFIPILPKRNVYDSLFGLLDNDSQPLCIFPVIMNFTSEFSLPDSVSYRKKFHSREPDHSCLQTVKTILS